MLVKIQNRSDLICGWTWLTVRFVTMPPLQINSQVAYSSFVGLQMSVQVSNSKGPKHSLNIGLYKFTKDKTSVWWNRSLIKHNRHTIDLGYRGLKIWPSLPNIRLYTVEKKKKKKDFQVQLRTSQGCNLHSLQQQVLLFEYKESKKKIVI